jgi:dynein heavy chain
MTTKVPSDYNTKVTDFQKLLFVKAFAPYLLVQSITYFVAEQLGKKFVESPSVELPILYQDMSNRTALVFILSTGSDPMSSFTRFATEMNMTSRLVLLFDVTNNILLLYVAIKQSLLVKVKVLLLKI